MTNEAATVDATGIRLEARSLFGRYGAQYAGPIGQDGHARRVLCAMKVEDVVDVVDALKAADGEPLSIGIYRAWIGFFAHDHEQVFAAWYNLGVELSASGAVSDAAAAFKTALVLRPNLYPAAINAGLCHEKLNDAEGALHLWTHATQSDQDRTALLNHRGRLLEDMKRFDEAEACLRSSLLTDPDQPDVIHHWTGIRAKSCAWPVLCELPGLDRDRLAACTGALSLLALTDDTAQHDRANAAWMARKFPPTMPRLSPTGGYAHRKLRIGYLSSDYCMHPMAYLVADLFEQHCRDAFTVYGYCSTKEDGSDVRRRILSSFDHTRSVLTLTDEALARLVRADEIDILIDLNGLTLGTRLPALRWRPAPVQITYLGYNASLPFGELDYILADRYVIPPETAATHHPKPLYLPSCFQSNDRKLPVAPRGTRAEVGLPDDAFVFCCFSNTYKITEAIFAAWITILRRCEGSVLWLYVDNAVAQRNLAERFVASGLAASRLHFAARTHAEVYRGRLALADLFLDTFPYNAGTTASDALRVGLPLVTLSGRSFISRMAGSLLQAIGLPDGIVDTMDAYIDRAVALAQDPVRYRAFRAAVEGGVWDRTLGDTPAFTRDLEDALTSVAVTRGAPDLRGEVDPLLTPDAEESPGAWAGPPLPPSAFHPASPPQAAG